jgi:S-adenosyl-L-methionine hydrolase (adenosine-forming)
MRAGAPIVTLLTDFGGRDSYLAEMKAVLVTAMSALTIVDISHEIEPGNVAMAAYLLSRSWFRFPSGTVHLVVVDPGVGTKRRAIAARVGGHGFVGPDNGVFGSILNDADVVELAVPEKASATFHGRDVFAPAACRLLRGESLTTLGTIITDAFIPTAAEPVRDGNRVIGQVVHVDRFGNLITNVSMERIPQTVQVQVGTVVVGPVRRTFGDVGAGQLVAYAGSGGALEVGVRGGNASRALSAGVGAEVVVVEV